MQIMTINFEGDSIKRDKEGRFSLNDLHLKSGGDPTKAPGQWTRWDNVKALVEVVQSQVDDSNYGKPHNTPVMVSKVGRYGGTFAILPLALAYAKYLSPEFHAACLKVLVEHLEENANPELGVTRSIDRAKVSYAKSGKEARPFSVTRDVTAASRRHA